MLGVQAGVLGVQAGVLGVHGDPISGDSDGFQRLFSRLPKYGTMPTVLQSKLQISLDSARLQWTAKRQGFIQRLPP